MKESNKERICQKIRFLMNLKDEIWGVYSRTYSSIHLDFGVKSNEQVTVHLQHACREIESSVDECIKELNSDRA